MRTAFAFLKGKEIEYCHILNRNLPDDIKVTAWAPCPTTSFRNGTDPASIPVSLVSSLSAQFLSEPL